MKFFILGLLLIAQTAFGSAALQDGQVTQKKLNVQVSSSSDQWSCTIATSVAANALTIALKTHGGADPTSLSPCKISYRNATSATGTYTQVSSIAALSMVVSSGSTLGTSSAVQDYLYIYLLNNAGASELAISHNLFDEGSIQSTTAEGGAGGADSALLMYSTVARANVPVRLIAKISVTEATAGTWATNASEVSPPPFFNYPYPIKYQEKVLTANVAAAGTIAQLTFNNLQIGRLYRVFLQGRLSTTSQTTTAIDITHAGSVIGEVRGVSTGPGGETWSGAGGTETFFIAAATTVTFVKVSGAGTWLAVAAPNAKSGTWARIEEIPFNLYQATTNFL